MSYSKTKRADKKILLLSSLASAQYKKDRAYIAAATALDGVWGEGASERERREAHLEMETAKNNGSY